MSLTDDQRATIKIMIAKIPDDQLYRVYAGLSSILRKLEPTKAPKPKKANPLRRKAAIRSMDNADLQRQYKYRVEKND